MVANGDGNGRSAGKLDDAAAMRLLSKLYDRDEVDAVEHRPQDIASAQVAEPAGESLVQAEAGMRELRSVFASMRESMSEEPPSRGLDALLQAARANVANTVNPNAPRAGVTASAPGFWAKLRNGWMNMLAHPGVMAAAALVVVAGAAGTIYLKTGAVDGGASEQQTRSSVATTMPTVKDVEEKSLDSAISGEPAPVVSIAAGSSVALPNEVSAGVEAKPGGEGQQKVATGSGDMKANGDELHGGVQTPNDGNAGTGRAGVAATKAAPSTVKERVVVSQDGKPMKKSATKASDDLGYQASDKGGVPEVAPTAPAASGDDAGPGSSVPVKQSPRMPPPAPVAAPPAPAPPPAPVTRSVPTTPSVQAPEVQQANKVLDDVRSNPKPEPTQALQPAALLTAAKRAASEGDCARARALAEQARTKDNRAYDLALKNDATLRACYKP
ncbi:MAG: hypothetical protein KBG15_01490 [Kofleriaceae bacterium]|nr:hypothetical protein [Kofleriaceae bacterium]